MTRKSFCFLSNRYFGFAAILLITTTTAATAQDTTADVTAACTAGSNMPPAICDCIGESSEEMMPDQRAFYVATLTGNDAETDRLRGAMEFAQLSEVIAFMRDAPANCAS
jgi:hypothetical protein